MKTNQSIQKKSLIIIVLLLLCNPIKAGWTGLVNSLSSFQDQLSFNQKLAVGLGLFAVTGYTAKRLYKKRLDSLKKKRYEERQQCLLPLIAEARSVKFYDLKKRCDELAFFKLNDRYFASYDEDDEKDKGADTKDKASALTSEEFHQVLDRYFKILLHSEAFEKTNWVNQNVANKIEEHLKASRFCADPIDRFDPYVQKIMLPQGAEVILFGDRHGDIHSLLKSLQDLSSKGYLNEENPFLINDSNVYIGFLGDWTDRGLNGVEVMTTILQLWSANPNNVFLVRGNHEDLSVNKKERINGFINEIKAKFPSECEESSREQLSLLEKIALMYETLPLATFIGCKDTKKTALQRLLSYFYNNDVINYALCCHGGAELGYDALPLLKHTSSMAFGKLGSLLRKTQINKMYSSSWIVNQFSKVLQTSDTPVVDKDSLKGNVEAYLAGELHDFKPNQVKTVLRNVNGVYTSDPKETRGYEEVQLQSGFQWHDYESNGEYEKRSIFARSVHGRAWAIGKVFNSAILWLYSNFNHKVRGVFRGHQHCDDPKEQMMVRILNSDDQDHNENRGVGRLWLPENVKNLPATKLWDNFVYTFNVAPNTPYRAAGFDFDTYGILTVQDKFEDWTTETIQV